MSDAVDARKQSHDAIEDAVRQHITDLEIEGVVTGWVIAISIAAMDDGDEFDMMYSTHSAGLSKWAEIGLLSVTLDGAKRDGYVE